MEIESLLKYKPLYKITGTPENFLTALRFKQWGFNENNKEQWSRIETGDIVCFHSKIKDSYFINEATSCVIGFGIVGNLKFITNSPLWIDEFQSDKLIYPYHFSFSEIVFFADIEINDTWDSQTLNKRGPTTDLINKILQKGIPLNQLQGFNPMGSFSILNKVDKALFLTMPAGFSVFDNDKEINDTITDPLIEINSIEESFRKASSLILTETFKKKVFNKKTVTTTKDLTLLERAENAHYETLEHTLKYFKSKGFNTFYNKNVDLFAYKNNTSFLIEVKSLENKNLVSQMRKGIAQLFEYNYFEVTKFKKEYNLNTINEVNLLVTSKEPSQNEYIKFVNSLNISIAIRNNMGLKAIGDDYGLNFSF